MESSFDGGVFAQLDSLQHQNNNYYKSIITHSNEAERKIDIPVRRIRPDKIIIIQLIINPTVQGLIKILYLTSCHIFVLVYKLIEIGSDDFVALPQDVNSVGGEYAGVVEQIHSTIHVEHEECEEVEHEDYENCCAFTIVIVVGIVDG